MTVDVLLSETFPSMRTQEPGQTLTMTGLAPGYQSGLAAVHIRVRQGAFKVTARPWLRAAPFL